MRLTQTIQLLAPTSQDKLVLLLSIGTLTLLAYSIFRKEGLSEKIRERVPAGKRYAIAALIALAYGAYDYLNPNPQRVSVRELGMAELKQLRPDDQRQVEERYTKLKAEFAEKNYRVVIEEADAILLLLPRGYLFTQSYRADAVAKLTSAPSQ